MRIFLIILLALMIGWAAPQLSAAQAQWNLGVSVDSEGLRGFHFSIGEHYRVPERDVGIVRQRSIPEEELPVVFYLASKAQVASGAILDLRLKGLSWMDITLRHGLSPEIYYVPVKVAKVGPPYGKAYGYYKKHPRQEWKKVVLHDDDVVNMVNLKFASDYYGYAPERVMQMRGEGQNFVAIHDHIKKEKRGKNGKGKDSDRDDDDRDRGQGKDKDARGKGKRERIDFPLKISSK
ncbi:MAG: hypothetical protein EHM27_02830 [Deltaproteobacteria bacterium]|nr:MAG: hypothetical protein EHM27_02830 [Deltaproteobacteria bacterium]